MISKSIVMFQRVELMGAWNCLHLNFTLARSLLHLKPPLKMNLLQAIFIRHLLGYSIGLQLGHSGVPSGRTPQELLSHGERVPARSTLVSRLPPLESVST